MQPSKNAIGNLINRYKAVLKKCHLLNTFGTLAVVGMLTASLGLCANMLLPKSAEAFTPPTGDYFTTKELQAGESYLSTFSITDNNVTTNYGILYKAPVNEATSDSIGIIIPELSGSTYTIDDTDSGKNLSFTVDGTTYYVNTSATSQGRIDSLTGSVGSSSDHLAFYSQAAVTDYGGAINNTADLPNADIYADFFKKSSDGGGAIYNGGTMGDITGDFIANTAIYSGGAIHNDGTMGNITGNFIANTTIGQEGGAIYNTGTMGDITGNFIANIVTSGNTPCGAIYNDGTMGNINANFINNTAGGSSGAIHNNGTMGDIRGDFIANNTHGSGGAIENFSTMGTINANFINNTAGANGGAIYTSLNLTFLADTQINMFSGNRDSTGSNAIYVYDHWGSNHKTLTFNMTGNGGFLMNDGIRGNTTYTVAISGDNTNNVFYLNNSIDDKGSVTLSNATLHFASVTHTHNGTATTYNGSVQNLSTSGTSVISGNAVINGTADISGTTSFSGTTNFKGTSSFNGTSNFNGTATFVNPATFTSGSTANFNQAITFNNANKTPTFQTGSTANFNENVTFDEAVSLANASFASGKVAKFNSTSNFSENVTFNGTTTFANTATFISGSVANFNSVITFNNTNKTPTFQAGSTANFNENVTFNEAVSLANASFAGGKVANFNSTSNFSENVTFNGTTTFANPATFTSGSTANFNQAITFNNANKTPTFQTGSTANFDENVTFDEAVSLANASFASGKVAKFNGTSNFNGNTTFASTANFADTATFASASTLIVDANTFTNTSVLSGNNTKLVVESGAKLQIANGANGDIVSIAEGFIHADSAIATGAWGGANLTSTSSLQVAKGADFNPAIGTYSIAITSNSSGGIHQDYSMAQGPTIDAMTNLGQVADVNSSRESIRFFSTLTDNILGTGTNDSWQTVQIWESALQMASGGATAFMGMGASYGAASIILGHLSQSGFTVTSKDGKAPAVVQAGQNNESESGIGGGSQSSADTAIKNGLALWLAPMYKYSTVQGMEAGAFKHGFDASMGGLALGADYTFNNAFRVGLAFNLGTGYAESMGDLSHTENDFDFWGLSLYGAYYKNNFSLMADVGFTSVYGEITQDVPSILGVSSLEANTQSMVWTAGLTAEYTFKTDFMDITPHAGVRYMHVFTDSYDTKNRRGTIALTKSDSQDVWYFPVGVTFSKDIVTDSGWTFTPKLDVGFIAAAGDLYATSVSSIPNVTGNYEYSIQNVDGFAFNGGFGIELAHKEHGVSLGVNYNLQASEHETGHMLNVVFRLEF